MPARTSPSASGTCKAFDASYFRSTRWRGPYWSRRRCSTPRRVPQKLQDLRMQRFIRGKNVASVQRPCPAVQIAHHASGLAHEQDSRRDIPRCEAALPESVEPPGRDIGQVQSGRTETPHARAFAHGRRKLGEESRVITLRLPGNARAENALVQFLARRHAQALV